ncbi:MAG: hypothetical protein K2N91_03340, partial [Muribaculaceae bacterium]|nr:hypothetical protein [Muribaculaceae bacterium]
MKEDIDYRIERVVKSVAAKRAEMAQWEAGYKVRAHRVEDAVASPAAAAAGRRPKWRGLLYGLSAA